MGYAKPYFISPAFAFVAYPNRDSVPFREYYNIPEAETVVRGTLRYQGFPEFIKALVQLGWLDAQEKEWLTEDLTWAEVFQKTLGTNDASEAYALSLFLHLYKDLRFRQHSRCAHQGALPVPRRIRGSEDHLWLQVDRPFLPGEGQAPCWKPPRHALRSIGDPHEIRDWRA